MRLPFTPFRIDIGRAIFAVALAVLLYFVALAETNPADQRKTNFTIPSTLLSGLTPMRFIADPIGGSRASVSQEITVAPGDTVLMTIPAV